MDIKRNLFFIVMIWFFCSGFSPENMMEIETAILQENYKAGEELSLKSLKENSSKEEIEKINYYLGLCYLREAKYEEAAAVFKKNLSIDNDAMRVRSYVGLFDVLYAQENYDQAFETIEAALDDNPQSDFLSLIYFKYARVSLKLARWGDAQKYFEKILKDFPQSLEAELADQLLNEKRYFSVQVGSFKERDKAENVLNALKEKGHYVYIIETMDKQNNAYYRVRVGQFSKLEEAQNLKSELSVQGYPTQIYP